MTTTTTTCITLRYGQGYAGKSGIKCWAARLTGTDATYGLQRAFLDPVKVEREHFNRPRTMIECAYALEIDGLYELCEDGDRWIVMCYTTAAGEAKTARVSDARAHAWVATLDAGGTNREARLASKGL